MKIPIPRALHLPLARPRDQGRLAEDAASYPLQWKILWMLIVVTLVQGAVYALVIPPWQAPDETGHFEYVWTLAHLGTIPSAQDTSPEFERLQIQSLYQYRYGDYIQRPLPAAIPDRLDDLPGTIFAKRSRPLLLERFSLAFIVPALILLPFQQQDLIVQLYIARFISILVNSLIVLIAFITFHEIHPQRRQFNLLAAVFIALMPQHTFINSSVSEGPLAELIACWVLYCWIRLFRRGPGVWEVAGIILGMIAGVFTKATTLFLIPASSLLALCWLITHGHLARSLSKKWSIAGGLTVVALMVALVTLTPAANRVLQIWNSLPALSELMWHDMTGLDLGSGLLLMYNSFWANFGWLSLPISQHWYIAIRILSLAALAGWAFGKQRDCDREIPAIMGFFVVIATISFIIGGFLTQDYYWIQGRYLFTVSIPFAFLFVHGLTLLFPIHLRVRLAVILIVCMAAFNIWCILGYVIPYFYG